MLDFTVINGETTVRRIDIRFLSTSSILFVGDIDKVSLTNAFESPPEEIIVGVATE